MKIVVWGINYSPELTGIAPYNSALCEYFRNNGHSVQMVTTFPYYPAWKKLPTDRAWIYRTDQLDGIAVHRCWHYVPRQPTSWKRILHEGTFVLFSFLRLLFISRPDVFVVISPPLLLGMAAWILTFFKRAPVAFHVQDLQPDAALGLGMLKPGWFTKLLYRLEAIAYRRAQRVSGITEGMLDAFKAKGVPAEKILYFPNGVSFPEEVPGRGNFRKRMGLSSNDFLAVYSGNLGVKQGLGTLLDAARYVQDPRIRIVICGEGAQRAALAERIQTEGLSNVLMLPLQRKDLYEEMLIDSDLSLITQQRGSGSFFFPSKLLTNLALARPVLTVADESSEVVAAMRGAGFGRNIEPGNPAELARELESLASTPDLLNSWGLAGRKFVEQFEESRVLGRFEQELGGLLSGRKTAGAVGDLAVAEMIH